MRNRTSDLQIPRSDVLTTKSQSLHGERDLLRSSYDHVLLTARISNVDSVMFVDRNKRDGKF